MGGTGAAVAEIGYDPILAIGPILAVFVALFAINSCSSAYEVWLETITTRAKLEDELDLTKERDLETDWGRLPIVPSRNIASRTLDKEKQKEAESKPDRKWVTTVLKLGDRRVAKYLFISFLFASLVLAVAILIIGLTAEPLAQISLA